jgi:microcystin-dependent protein
MASVLLSPYGVGQQFFDDNGVPLAGGLIYTYQAGSSTPLATYTTNGGTIANSNPIVLDASGRVPQEIWLFTGYSYKFILKNADDVLIQTLDDIYPILQNAPASAPAVPSGIISLWSGSTGSIPSGWLLCDGTNGTPDLRDRFIIGAGNTYAVGATGGTADAIVVSHTHSATSSVTDPGHFHLSSGTNGGSQTGFLSSDGDNTPQLPTTTETTGITVGTTVASAGVSGTGANIPPYYALAYIQKS